jgi:hypothetical protein
MVSAFMVFLLRDNRLVGESALVALEGDIAGGVPGILLDAEVAARP